MNGPGRIGNEAMRDKVEHMRDEVNVDSRRCGKLGIELLIPTMFERLLRNESSCPISEQYNLS
jgi:hypothetical protein